MFAKIIFPFVDTDSCNYVSLWEFQEHRFGFKPPILNWYYIKVS
jgi:hypothetical protein